MLKHYLLFLVEVIYLAVQALSFGYYCIVDDRLNGPININGKVAHGFLSRMINRFVDWSARFT